MKAQALQVVREDDGGAIVAVIVVEGKAVDDAVERGHHFGAGGAPDVDAEVEAAGFGFTGPAGSFGAGGLSGSSFGTRGLSGSSRRADEWVHGPGAGYGLVEVFAAGVESPVFSITAETITGLVL